MEQGNIFDVAKGVRDTSLEAYKELIETGAAEKQREKVFLAIYNSQVPLTRQELSFVTGKPVNVICGRVNELIKEGAVIEGKKRACTRSGRKVYTLRTAI